MSFSLTSTIFSNFKPEDKDLNEKDKNLMDSIRRKLMNDYSQVNRYN